MEVIKLGPIAALDYVATITMTGNSTGSINSVVKDTVVEPQHSGSGSSSSSGSNSSSSEYHEINEVDDRSVNGTSERKDQDDEDEDNVVESAGDGTTAADQVLHGVPLLLCSISLLLCMFLVALDQTIVATILSTVGNKFDDFGDVSWIASGFLLPTAVLAMNWGKISLVFGRKYTMIAAVILFEGGSLMCALANSMDVLIGGRVLAGVGGGGIQVMVFVIITEITTIDKRGMFQGLIGAAFGIASVVGPLVGGAFTSHVSWRWCFYINLPVGGVALAFITIFFNPPRTRGSLKEKLLMIDYFGTLLLGAGLTLLLLALSLGSTTDPWNSAVVISFFVVGGVLCLVFCFYNFRISKNPLIPWRVAKVPTVMAPCLAIAFLMGSFMTGVLYLSTYFQVVLGADAMHSGIDLLPLIIPLVITSITMGVVVSKTRYTKPFAHFGTSLVSIGFGLMTLLDAHSSLGRRMGFQILTGIGVGCLFQSMALSLQISAPKDQGGVLVATAMLGMFRSLGAVLGSSVGQTIQSVVFSTGVSSLDLPGEIDPDTLLSSPDTINALSPELQTLVIDAFVKGFQRVMYFALAFALTAFVCTLFFTNKRIPKNNTGGHQKNDVENPKLSEASEKNDN